MIPSIKPLVGQDENDAVVRVFQSSMLAQGSEVAAFEREFADYCGVRHDVAVNSGTTAIHAILPAPDIGPGNEVTTTHFTFVATASPILMCGGKPVFADTNPDSFNLDPECICEAITPYTKAIIAAQLFGLTADWGRLRDIVDLYNLPLLEDACQAVGAKCKTAHGRNWSPEAKKIRGLDRSATRVRCLLQCGIQGPHEPPSPCLRCLLAASTPTICTPCASEATARSSRMA